VSSPFIGINLQKFRDTHYNLYLKREVINNYAFNMAFENSIEPGYVTEKPFDALVAGSVPVFVGDSKHLKALIPHPKAVIFVDAFPSIAELSNYLKYLLSNETAYEEHREWRKEFSYEKNVAGNKWLDKSWQCHVCEWAARQYHLSVDFNQSTSTSYNSVAPRETLKISNKICPPAIPLKKGKLDPKHEGFLYRSKTQKGIYLVKEGLLHLIPDFGTFVALGYDLSSVKVIEPHEFDAMIIGDDLPRSG
jgi:hypothetical protein